MKRPKTSTITIISFYIVAAIAIGTDIWLDAREDSFTWSQYLQRKAIEDPAMLIIYTAILTLITGLLLGHWFWPKRIYDDTLELENRELLYELGRMANELKKAKDRKDR
jgi:vacuolar-type H+-ATPase subunit I/STV1|tara:strand:+ start:52 stop:378 length:327 start_codon:yes stop_codon:yes gene_type:complete